MEKYVPPFEITAKMLTKATTISEKITKLDNFSNLNKKPYLRKQTKINSIHSSLAIENNNLSLNQVRDVINGKLVLGPQKEIQEVKNAYKAYEMINKINPYSIEDLKRIHGVMTFLTVDDYGEFRKGNEGVFDGNKCIFVCPPPEMVNELIKNLFNWMKENKDKLHPLILSSIFHYEFVFIHPFSDESDTLVKNNLLFSNWVMVIKYDLYNCR